LTSIVAPTIYVASSEHKKATTLAISSGFPIKITRLVISLAELAIDLKADSAFEQNGFVKEDKEANAE
jgi:hypothetical protein